MASAVQALIGWRATGMMAVLVISVAALQKNQAC